MAGRGLSVADLQAHEERAHLDTGEFAVEAVNAPVRNPFQTDGMRGSLQASTEQSGLSPPHVGVDISKDMSGQFSEQSFTKKTYELIEDVDKQLALSKDQVEGGCREPSSYMGINDTNELTITMQDQSDEASKAHGDAWRGSGIQVYTRPLRVDSDEDEFALG